MRGTHRDKAIRAMEEAGVDWDWSKGDCSSFGCDPWAEFTAADVMAYLERRVSEDSGAG